MAKRDIETYAHAGTERVNNPPVGLPPQWSRLPQPFLAQKREDRLVCLWG